MDSVQFAAAPLDSIWMRDYGPLFVNTTHGGQRIIDPRYYYGRFSDDVMPTRMAYWWDMDVSRPPIDMEGGNFQSDGAGRCITTEMVLWQNNERHYDEQDIKQLFQSYYGCSTTVILPTIYGEGTGHVDMYATITGPGQVIVGDYSWEDDSTNAARLDSAATELESAGFSVRRIPMPSNADGAYRSYTNSLAIGNKVLVPIYYDDRRYEGPAISAFEQAYPNKTIVPIDATNIIQWSGAIHCVTMTVNK
jgi:agmatine/peptidylarginine deiminase